MFWDTKSTKMKINQLIRLKIRREMMR